ncbi:MAG TPA: energy transducer TonB [Mariprofundaceae bacterium]|nr:energy transducer TonB [Mariprofundaceae bacterium]
MNKENQQESKRFGIAFSASIVTHILLIVLIGIMQTPPPLNKKQEPQIMDVVLLPSTTPSKRPPKDARTMSNLNAEGGDTKAQDKMTRTARAPVVGGEQQSPQPTPPQQPRTPPPTPDTEQRARLLARRGPEPNPNQTPKNLKTPTPTKTQPLPQVPLSSLMPSTMALAELSRDFERERRMKQMLTREADIPINTREAKYAPYAQELVRALEEQWRPGKADYGSYPEDARKALMRVTIEHNGDLGGVEILRPSPIPQINESAVEAIQAASPFKPLPSSWGMDRVSFYLTFEVIEDKFVFHTM